MRKIALIVPLVGVSIWVGAQSHTVSNHTAGAPRVTVLVFLGLDCPVSQKYIATLNNLYQKFEGQVVMRAFVPGDAKEKTIRKFKKQYRVRFDLIGDAGLILTQHTGATITPEVFVYRTDDSALEHFVYRGAIDNWFYELGRYRAVTTEHYLEDAINAVLDGKEPAIKETRAIGCFIQLPEVKNDHHHH